MHNLVGNIKPLVKISIKLLHIEKQPVQCLKLKLKNSQ